MADGSRIAAASRRLRDSRDPRLVEHPALAPLERELLLAYEVRGERRRAVMERLRLPERRFHRVRSAALARIADAVLGAPAAPHASTASEPAAAFGSGANATRPPHASRSAPAARPPATAGGALELDVRLDLRFARADALVRAGERASARACFEDLLASVPGRAARAIAATRLARLDLDDERHDDVTNRLGIARALIRDGGAERDAAAAAAHVEFVSSDAALVANRYRDAAEIAERALAELGTDDADVDAERTPLRLRLLLNAGAAMLYRGELSRARAMHAAAERTARLARDLDMPDRVQLLSARALFEGLDVDGLGRSQAANVRALGLAARAGLTNAAWVAAHNLAKFAFQAGVPVETSQVSRDAFVFAMGNPAVSRSDARHRAFVTAFAAASNGRIDEAIGTFADLRGGRTAENAAGILLHESKTLANGARYQASAARADDAARSFATAGRAASYGAARSLHGAALLKLGDKRGAARSIDDASAILSRSCVNLTHLARVLRCRHELTGRRSYLVDALDIERALVVAATGESGLPRALESAQGLTARQREIGALLAGGSTRREIGKRLNISERTVAHHAEAIYARLGVRARWQLAAFFDR